MHLFDVQIVENVISTVQLGSPSSSVLSRSTVGIGPVGSTVLSQTALVAGALRSHFHSLEDLCHYMNEMKRIQLTINNTSLKIK